MARRKTRAKLQTGFAEGKNILDSANWYQDMGQLENEY